MAYPCSDLATAAQRNAAVKPSGHGCKECLEMGDEWVHLRLCLSCGHVGCCDDSQNKHASKHYRSSHHPVIRSFEPGEEWGYCYRHEEGVAAMPGMGEEIAAEHYEAPLV